VKIGLEEIFASTLDVSVLSLRGRKPFISHVFSPPIQLLFLPPYAYHRPQFSLNCSFHFRLPFCLPCTFLSTCALTCTSTTTTLIAPITTRCGEVVATKITYCRAAAWLLSHGREIAKARARPPPLTTPSTVALPPTGKGNLTTSFAGLRFRIKNMATGVSIPDSTSTAPMNVGSPHRKTFYAR
jgi:hypothetical protein